MNSISDLNGFRFIYPLRLVKALSDDYPRMSIMYDVACRFKSSLKVT